MSLVKMILKKYIKVPKLETFKNVLFIGPHPDDIEFGCGATISKLKENGANIHFLIVTDGASGTKSKDDNPLVLKETREKEARSSASFLGASTIDFLNFEDGGDYSKDECMKALIPYVLKYNPEIIFTTDPTLSTECHPDHIKVGEAVKTLTQIVTYPHSLMRNGIDISGYDTFPKGIYLALFYTDKPNKRVRISKKHWKNKEKALFMHESQMEGDNKLFVTYFKVKGRLRGISHFSYMVEEYKVYHPLMEHSYLEGF